MRKTKAGKTKDRSCWEGWFKENKREDALVIPEDLMPILGEKKYQKYGTKDEEVRREIRQASEYLYGGERLGVVDPRKHQRVADSICACTIVGLVEKGSSRERYLLEMVRDAKCCVRTNYQFVRTFLRRNLSAFLRVKKVDLAEFTEVFPPNIREELARMNVTELTKELSDWLKRNPALLLRAIEAGATIAGLIVCLCKGEFTHFDEIFDVLDALSKKGVNVGIVVSNEERYDYIADSIRRAGSKVVSKHLKSEVFRYYVFPREYILLISGAPKQFLICWGKTRRSTTNGARALAMHDWNAADIAICE